MAALIFIVDDEAHIRKLLELGLRDNGFDVRAFADGEAFLAAIRTQLPEAVVLDWMMTPLDGMALVALLRKNVRTRHIPIVMLTAKAAEKDKIAGLDEGADDYVTKPFSVKELAARLRTLLRRETYLSEKDTLTCGDLELFQSGRDVRCRGQALALTMREFDLLCALMKHKEKVLPRERLIDMVWGIDYEGDTRTLDVHIRYLRKKLAQEGSVACISTFRGIGYRLDPYKEEQTK